MIQSAFPDDLAGLLAFAPLADAEVLAPVLSPSTADPTVGIASANATRRRGCMGRQGKGRGGRARCLNEQLLLEALARGLNVKGERLPKSNLDRYPGDSDLGANWDRDLDQDLHRIDPELWT